jgi:predicted nucleotidyltransferase
MDIYKIFNSKARRALFLLYFTNTENAYYLRELERMLNMPVSIIRKELMRLEADRIFLSEKRGNLLYYLLNKDYSLFEELKSIVRKTIGVEALLKNAVSEIQGIKTAFIYGSFAAGQEKAASDIDFLVIGRVNEDELAMKISALERSIKREINYTLFSREEFKKKRKEKDSFITDILVNKKIMLKGQENEL